MKLNMNMSAMHDRLRYLVPSKSIPKKIEGDTNVGRETTSSQEDKFVRGVIDEVRDQGPRLTRFLDKQSLRGCSAILRTV